MSKQDAPFPEGMVAEIERFFQTEPERPGGWDLYPQVFDTGLFFPLQRQKELAEMMRLARKVNQKECPECCNGMREPGKLPESLGGEEVSCWNCNGTSRIGGPFTVMEIGCDKGGGLYHWCKCLPTVESVIACEIRGVPYRHAFHQAFPEIEFLWLGDRSSYSPEVVNEVDHFTCYDGDLIDCLFIDGEKKGMEKDFDAYLPMMRPGGLVFLHDVQDDYPARAFTNIQRRGFKTELILDRTEGLEAAERYHRAEEPRNAYDQWLMHWGGRSCGVGIVHVP